MPVTDPSLAVIANNLSKALFGSADSDARIATRRLAEAQRDQTLLKTQREQSEYQRGLEKQQQLNAVLTPLFGQIGREPRQFEGPRTPDVPEGPMPTVTETPIQVADRNRDALASIIKAHAQYGDAKPADLMNLMRGLGMNAVMGQSTTGSDGARQMDVMFGGKGKDVYINRGDQLADETSLALTKANAEGGAGMTAAMRLRTQKIQQLMELNNIDQRVATGIVDGNVKLTTDEYGNRVITDLATGKSVRTEIENPTKQVAFSPTPDVTTRDITFDPGEATGAKAAAINLFNNTLAQTPMFSAMEGPEDAAQSLTYLERDLIKALASSSRPPVIEQERIMAMIPKPFDMWQNPQIARNKVSNVLSLLMDQYKADYMESQNALLPPKVKTELASRMQGVKGIMRRNTTPDVYTKLFPGEQAVPAQAGNLPQPMSEAEYDQLPSGAEYLDPEGTRRVKQ